MCKFNVGDKVRIIGKSHSFNERPTMMKPYLGKVYTIHSISCDTLKFVEDEHINPSERRLNNWSWHTTDVELVTGIVIKSLPAEVKFFGPTVKLENGKYGVKISRKSNFMLKEPITVLNGDGREYSLVGFFRASRKAQQYWVVKVGEHVRSYQDPYFFIEVVSPAKKMTIKEIEEKLGHKIELVKA